MDKFNSRHLENEVFDIIREPVGGAEVGGIEDGSEFLNESGPGMEEPERSVDAQTSIECNDDSLIRGPPQSGEVFDIIFLLY